MRQIIIDFGKLDFWWLHFNLRIYGYGLMLVGGFLTGIWLARRRARRFGESGDYVTNVGLLALVGGVVGPGWPSSSNAGTSCSPAPPIRCWRSSISPPAG